MKGGLVIAVAALEALEACGVPANWTFTLNSDEETGTYHSEQALRDEAAAHDYGIALEPALADGSLAIAGILYGDWCSYAEIARRIGRPKAVRAVGAANGANPLPLVIPCHRVLSSSGHLQGYAGGLDMKARLLAMEKSTRPGQVALF